MKDHEQCFAILRIDESSRREVALENVVTVKLVTWQLDVANVEAERLNKLNADKGCRYVVVTTRARPRPKSDGPGSG
jgi:hypothetical protein